MHGMYACTQTIWLAKTVPRMLEFMGVRECMLTIQRMFVRLCLHSKLFKFPVLKGQERRNS